MKRDREGYEVAIIGGGVCGSAAAYYLAKAGVKVALIEREGICSGTSGTNPGFCVLTYREDPVVMELALEQRIAWPALSRELDLDLEYYGTGGTIPFSQQEELDVLAGLVDNCHRWGLGEVAIVSPERASEQEPALDPSRITGAIYCPWEGRLNPFKLNIGLAEKARQLGADLFTGTRVTGMEVANGEVKALITARGTIAADLFICAAGAWSKDVVALAGADLPIKYERGEAMASISCPPIIRGIVTDGGLFVKQEVKPEMVVGACLAQTTSGNIIMAQATSTVENYDCSSTYEGPVAISKRVLTLFPQLADLEILRMWGGVVAYVSDRVPLFGFLENPKNLFVIVGFHSAIGIAPAIGRMVQDIYLKGGTRYDVSNYSPSRFNRPTM